MSTRKSQRRLGHNRPAPGAPLIERLCYWTEFDDEGCWIWQGHKTPTGYGHITTTGQQRIRLVHRAAYELLVGPIPDGLTIDHLCRVRDCWRPAHLEPVTQGENSRRTRVDRCGRGHNLTEDNVRKERKPGGVSRRCATCHRYWRHYAKQDGTEYVRLPHPREVQVSEETKAAIRAEYRRGVKGHDQHALAARYGLSRNKVQRILSTG